MLGRSAIPGFYRLNDLLQWLGTIAFRPPVPAYSHDGAVLPPAGLIRATPPPPPQRPGATERDPPHDRRGPRPSWPATWPRPSGRSLRAAARFLAHLGPLGISFPSTTGARPGRRAGGARSSRRAPHAPTGSASSPWRGGTAPTTADRPTSCAAGGPASARAAPSWCGAARRSPCAPTAGPTPTSCASARRPPTTSRSCDATASTRDQVTASRLTHSGRWSGRDRPARSPTRPARRPPRPDQVLTDDELDALVDDYVSAAELAHEAGLRLRRREGVPRLPAPRAAQSGARRPRRRPRGRPLCTIVAGAAPRSRIRRRRAAQHRSTCCPSGRGRRRRRGRGRRALGLRATTAAPALLDLLASTCCGVHDGRQPLLLPARPAAGVLPPRATATPPGGPARGRGRPPRPPPPSRPHRPDLTVVATGLLLPPGVAPPRGLGGGPRAAGRRRRPRAHGLELSPTCPPTCWPAAARPAAAVPDLQRLHDGPPNGLVSGCYPLDAFYKGPGSAAGAMAGGPARAMPAPSHRGHRRRRRLRRRPALDLRVRLAAPAVRPPPAHAGRPRPHRRRADHPWHHGCGSPSSSSTGRTSGRGVRRLRRAAPRRRRTVHLDPSRPAHRVRSLSTASLIHVDRSDAPTPSTGTPHAHPASWMSCSTARTFTTWGGTASLAPCAERR